MMSSFNYKLLPEYMREGAERYVDSGILPGGFLQAVIRNSLIDSAAKADNTNQHYLYIWAQWLNSIPRACWGSQKAMDDWIEHKGLHGLGGV